MFGIPSEHLIPIGNFIGIGILGILAYFGQRWGKQQPTPADRQVQVEGALVDSSAVRELTAVLSSIRAEAVAGHADAEKARQVAHKAVDAMTDIASELEELRREMRALGDRLAK